MTDPPTARDQPACLVLADEVWGSTLHAMRSLDALGARVLVVTAGRGSAVYGRSRVRPATLDIESLDRDSLRRALTWAREQVPSSKIVVLPLSDRAVDVMDDSRDLLAEPFRPILAPKASLHRLLAKPASLTWATQIGLDVPPWRQVASPEDLPLLDDLTSPVIIRPTSWATAGSSPFKVSVQPDRDTAVAFCRSALSRGAELLVQEYLPAADEDVEFALVWCSTDGTATATCTGRKRRQSSPEGGVMAWGETLPIPDVADAAERFVEATGFTGPGGLEFIRTPTGLRFIEFNPRLEAIHFLAARGGVDLVKLTYRDVALGQLPTTRPRQVPASGWVGSAWLARIRQDPRSVSTLIADRWAFAHTPRRVRAVVAIHDPGPALGVVSLLGRGAWRRRRS